jgi:hypothetical protein
MPWQACAQRPPRDGKDGETTMNSSSLAAIVVSGSPTVKRGIGESTADDDRPGRRL